MSHNICIILVKYSNRKSVQKKEFFYTICCCSMIAHLKVESRRDLIIITTTNKKQQQKFKSNIDSFDGVFILTTSEFKCSLYLTVFHWKF